jgi:hypothetical protein
MAFSMQDVLLEPYGGQVLGMSVGATTKLTATLALGGLLGFGLASACWAAVPTPSAWLLGRAARRAGLPGGDGRGAHRCRRCCSAPACC